jgi:hypothetical protein
VVLTENTTETKLFGASWSNNLNRFSLPNLDEMDVLTGQFAITLSLIIETNNTNTHDYFIPTLDTITIENYIRPLQIWCPLLNESFMTCFLTRFKLEYHLSLLHDYFLLANGVFASGLKSVFYQDSRRPLTLLLNGNRAHIWPPRSFDLNMVLRALLLESSSSGEDLITFGVRKDNSTKRWTNPNGKNIMGNSYVICLALTISFGLFSGRSLGFFVLII